MLELTQSSARCDHYIDSPSRDAIEKTSAVRRRGRSWGEVGLSRRKLRRRASASLTWEMIQNSLSFLSRMNSSVDILMNSRACCIYPRRGREGGVKKRVHSYCGEQRNADAPCPTRDPPHPARYPSTAAPARRHP